MDNAWTGTSMEHVEFFYAPWKILPWYETFSNHALLTFVSKKVSDMHHTLAGVWVRVSGERELLSDQAVTVRRGELRQAVGDEP